MIKYTQLIHSTSHLLQRGSDCKIRAVLQREQGQRSHGLHYIPEFFTYPEQTNTICFGLHHKGRKSGESQSGTTGRLCAELRCSLAQVMKLHRDILLSFVPRSPPGISGENRTRSEVLENSAILLGKTARCDPRS